MTQIAAQPPPRRRGDARVTFRAHLPLIRAELEAGWTAKSVFERHAAKLGSMSYRQFMRHIAREIVGVSRAARPVAGEVASAVPSPSSPKPIRGDAPSPPIPTTGVDSDARHEPGARDAGPVARAGFRHDPRTKEGEPEQLLGPGFLGDRRR